MFRYEVFVVVNFMLGVSLSTKVQAHGSRETQCRLNILPVFGYFRHFLTLKNLPVSRIFHFLEALMALICTKYAEAVWLPMQLGSLWLFEHRQENLHFQL